MEGSYGRSAFQQQGNNLQSPMTPNTPASASQYKTNINRTKTRKWVEAKTQNYDGDDWGDEYGDGDDDDDYDAPEPPRQAPPPSMPSQQPQLPSQLPAQPSAVPSSTIRSNLPSATPNMSQGIKAPAGQSPLQIQTQQHQSSPTSVSLPLSPETNSPFQSMAPPSKISREPTPTRMASPPQTSPPIAQAPAATSQTQNTARFPSQGQKELPAQTQPGPASKPAGPRPWTDARSTSPAHSPVATTKALPFIRPSDIYKRVEEEKEKQRQSLDSSRPSIDSAGGSRSNDRPDTVNPKAEPEPSVSAAKQHTPAKPSVDTAAPGAPKYYPTKNQPPSFQSGGAAAPQEEGDEDEDIRRYSSSPKLPDLARMSTFGADFFSNPSSFTAPDAPPMPSIRDIPEHPEKETELEKKVEFASSKEPSLDMTTTAKSQGLVPVADAAAAPNALGIAPAAAASQDRPLAEGKSPATSKPRRPSVPGAWVSEISEASTITEATPVAEKNEMEAVGLSGSRAAADAKAGVVPTATSTQDASQVQNHNEERSPPKTLLLDAAPKLDEAPRAKSPSLPPLKIESDTTPALADRKLDITTTQSIDPTKPQTMPATSTPASAVSDIKPTAPLVPRAGTSPQDFVPPPSVQRISTMSTTNNDSPVKESDKLRDEIIRTLSPVKPSQDFSEMTRREPEKSNAPSEPVSRKSTYLDDVYDDYWGDEDKPESGALDAPDVPKIPDSVKAPETLPPQPEPKIILPPQQPQAPVAPIAPIAPPVAVPTASESIYPAVRPLSPRAAQQTADEPLSASGHRRFSWEAISDQVPDTMAPSITTRDGPSEPEPEPKSLATVPSEKPTSPPISASAAQSLTSGAGHLSPGATKPQSAADAKIGSISHSVSQASTLPPGVIAALEPPSPLSVMSDQKPDQHSKSMTAEAKRLSIAEEKEALTPPTSSSSSPHLQHHPALAAVTDSTTHPVVSSPVAASRPGAANLNIMSFKQCMAPEIASERIERLHETRSKFSTIDSGLDEWIRYMQLDPEHAKATGSLRDDMGFHQMLNPGGPQQPGQQQHAAAGASGVHGPQPGRMSGNAPNFSHSTQQVQAKGKELLFTAGKLGKGLLSKGRSKLRQAGDKVNS